MKGIFVKGKGIAALLIMSILLSGLLAGCGGSKDTAANAEAAVNAEAEANAETAANTEAAVNDEIMEHVIAEETSEPENVDMAVSEETGQDEVCAAWPEENTEEYSELEESGFSAVYSDPLSTFSADVDTASYSNLRRLVQEGYGLGELPEGAVRIEEIINYFSYGDLEEPKGREPFGVTAQVMPCPWNEDSQLLRIGLKTEEIDYSDLPESNLVFLLDVSGSMYSEDKLPLLQDSFALLAENLTEKDRVSIVTYAGDDTVVIEGVSGNHTKEICEALFELEAGGSTHGSKGIETAYSLAEDYYIEGGNNRVILATDGDLNVGLTTEEELEDLITEKKESGVFLSVLGFGTGNIKDNKMETLADKGNGNYAYIDSLKEAHKVLVEEMGATLLTVCKDVKFQVEFNPAVVKEYRLIGYENRRLAAEDFEDDRKDAGEIGAGHCVTALYEIITNEPVNGRGRKDDGSKEEAYENTNGNIKYSGSYKEDEWLTISIRYKEPDGRKSMLLEYPVDYTSYTEEPDDDFLFVAAAAEFGLTAMDSEYKEDASLEHVIGVLKKIDLDDEYKEEFAELVKEFRKNSR